MDGGTGRHGRAVNGASLGPGYGTPMELFPHGDGSAPRAFASADLNASRLVLKLGTPKRISHLR